MSEKSLQGPGKASKLGEACADPWTIGSGLKLVWRRSKCVTFPNHRHSLNDQRFWCAILFHFTSSYQLLLLNTRILFASYAVLRSQSSESIILFITLLFFFFKSAALLAIQNCFQRRHKYDIGSLHERGSLRLSNSPQKASSTMGKRRHLQRRVSAYNPSHCWLQPMSYS